MAPAESYDKRAKILPARCAPYNVRLIRSCGPGTSLARSAFSHRWRLRCAQLRIRPHGSSRAGRSLHPRLYSLSPFPGRLDMERAFSATPHNTVLTGFRLCGNALLARKRGARSPASSAKEGWLPSICSSRSGRPRGLDQHICGAFPCASARPIWRCLCRPALKG